MPLISLISRPGHALPEGACDIRGWPVVTLVDGEKAGEVHDLLLDDRGVPRYLDIDLGLFRKHVLLPIGQARADRSKQVVWVPGFTRDQFREIPAYRHDPAALTRDEERGIVAAYKSAYAGERYRPRPSFAGAVYGPSELETAVRVEGRGRTVLISALLDFRIPPGEADPRGWTVVTAAGEPVGEVVDLVVDTEAMKVSQMVLEPVGPLRGGPRVLLPAEVAELDRRHHVVRAPGFDAERFRRLPPLPGESGERTGTPDAEEFYDDPRFSTRTFYGPGEE